jgi:hypothetical protein
MFDGGDCYDPSCLGICQTAPLEDGSSSPCISFRRDYGNSRDLQHLKRGDLALSQGSGPSSVGSATLASARLLDQLSGWPRSTVGFATVLVSNATGWAS